jgi:inorganic pyrophosphatase
VIAATSAGPAADGPIVARGRTPAALEVVIETPKGSQNKLKYDEAAGRFRLSHVLPTGMAFPFDFGFIPKTRAEDGDPLDVLVLTDAALPMGVLADVRLVGVLEVEQREETGEVVRNDRLIAVAEESTTHAAVRELDDVSPTLLDEIEAFFDQYNRLDGKAFRVLHRRGSRAAADIVRRSQEEAA